MSKIEEEVEALVKSKIEDLNYELYDVLFIKEGQNRILRIVIDSIDGITLNDCEKVNNEVKDIVDEADLIKEQYFFEVSSPGIERLLRKEWQLKKYIGSLVNIKMFKKDENGNKEYTGILLEVNENDLKIKTEEKQIQIAKKNISLVKTVYIED